MDSVSLCICRVFDPRQPYGRVDPRPGLRPGPLRVSLVPYCDRFFFSTVTGDGFICISTRRAQATHTSGCENSKRPVRQRASDIRQCYQ